MSISLCVLCNEKEKDITVFLNKLEKYIDEIILVYTGKDNNFFYLLKDKANKNKKIKLHRYKWCDNFSKARNFSIKKATKNWILILDPDEEIENIDLLFFLTKNKKTIAYKFFQKTYSKKKIPLKWRDEPIDNYPGYNYRGIIRLFRNNKKIKFIYPIHETVINSIKDIDGKIGDSGIIIKQFKKEDKEKDRYYYSLLKKKIERYPTANSYAEIAVQCYRMGNKKEMKIYIEKAIRTNDGYNFLRKLK